MWIDWKIDLLYLDVGVVHDQGWRHLQSEVIILPPVQHEGDTLLSNHLTQRHICRQQIHPLFRTREVNTFPSAINKNRGLRLINVKHFLMNLISKSILHLP